MPSTQTAPIGATSVRSVQFVLLQTGVDCLFYGIQATLFFAACAVLARQSNRSHVVTAAIVGLFVSSTIGVALDISFFIVQMPALGAATVNLMGLLTHMNIVIGVAFRFNYLISDAIVVWRAWVLWPDSRIAQALLSICMGGSVVGVIIECVWAITSLGSEEDSARTLMMTIPLLVTNVVATTLVGLQVWYYRRNVRGSLGPWATTRVGKVLVLLVESGLVYCLIWAVYLVINITEGPDTLAVYGVISAAYHTIAGIYPTFIVLVVAMQRSAAESICGGTQLSHSVHFASTWKGKRPSTSGGATTSTMNDDLNGGVNTADPSEWSQRHEALHNGRQEVYMMTTPIRDGRDP